MSKSEEWYKEYSNKDKKNKSKSEEWYEEYSRAKRVDNILSSPPSEEATVQPKQTSIYRKSVDEDIRRRISGRSKQFEVAPKKESVEKQEVYKGKQPAEFIPPSFDSFVNKGNTPAESLQRQIDYDLNKFEVQVRNEQPDLSDDEVGKEVARRVADDINKARAIQTERQFKEFGEEHPTAATLMSVGTNFASPIGAVAMYGEAMKKGIDSGTYELELDPYSRYGWASRVTTSAREGAKNSLESVFDSEAGKNIAGYVYDVGTGILDMAAAGAVGGFAGNVSKPVTLALMSAQAGAGTTQEAAERELPIDIALAESIGAFASSYMLERLPYNDIFDPKYAPTLKQLALNIIKGAVGEGLEEGAEDIINTAIDTAFAGDQSKIKTSIKAYESQGYDTKEATKKALWDKVKETLYSIAVGAGSGGVMAGGGSLPGYVHSNVNAYQTGKALTENKNFSVDSLVEMGSKMSADSAAYKIANKVNDKTGAYTIGKLFNSVGAELSVQNQQDIVESLTHKGISEENAKDYSSWLSDVINGAKLTEQQMQILEKNKAVADTFREVIINPNSTINQRRQAWFEAGGFDIAPNTDTDTGAYSPDAVMDRINKSQMFETQSAPSLETQLAQLAQETASKSTESPTAEKSNPFVPLAKQTAPVQNTEKIKALDSVVAKEHDVSDIEGKTILKNTNEAVNIKKIASIDKNSMKLELDDGRVVSSKDVSYGTQGEALVYETVANMDVPIPADAANSIVSMYNPNGKQSAAVFSKGVAEAYRYGYLNMPKSELIEKSSFAVDLTEHQRETAYKLGSIMSTTRAKADTQNVGRGKQGAIAKGKVIYTGNSKLTKRQRTNLKALKVIARITGIQIEVFESNIDEYGRRIGENGSYDPNTGKMRIDLYAGVDGDSLMLFTVAHELTHHIKNWSPEKFKILADFLMEQYGEKGVSVDALVQAQIEKAARSGRTLTYEAAYEEVIADSMESMLSDGEAIVKLKMLATKDQSLVQKIRDFLGNLVAKIKKEYAGLKPDSQEGQLVADMIDATERLQSLFAEALMDATVNYTNAKSELVNVDAASESASPKLSERTWTASSYVVHREATAKMLAQTLGVTKKKALEYIDNVNSIARLIADDRVRLDYEASPFGSAFVSNSEYGGSFDFTTLCKKRRLYTGTFSEIQKRLGDVALTPDHILEIRNMLTEAGKEATCGLCYVEGSRANMGKFAKEFIRLYKRDNPDAWIPSMYDVNTPDGVESMKRMHPEAYEQYEFFWNHYGKLKADDKALFASQQKPKLYESRKEYKGEILESFSRDTTVQAKNRNGGIRMQSFSDFELVHLIDTMQIIMDMASVGLAGQAYTKVPEFADAFGNTGLKINLSLIAKGVDENGKLIFDDREGMPHETAFGLRNKYSKNVGTIIVTFTDEQLQAAMADSRIDFIIPFHRSQWKKGQYQAMGLPQGTKDYTYMQNEKLIKPTYHEYRGRMVKDKASNYMPNEYWDFSKSGKENAEAYLEMCAKENKRPKFYKLLDYDGKGTYSLKKDGSTDGYWKLLIDFKMYDNNGVGSAQQPVTPNFSMDEAIEMLNEYKGGHQSYPVAHDVVDRFVENYNSKGNDLKLSDRDSSYMTAVESGNMNKAQALVEEAAINAGLKYVGLHGTGRFGFTEFDRKKSYSGGAHFFTTKYRVADSYSGAKGVTQISSGAYKGSYKVALDIKNPLEIDCKNHLWNDIPYNIGKGGKVSTVDVVEYAERQGYDGIIFRNLIDPGEHITADDEYDIGYTDEGKKKWSSTVFAVFNSNQIKSLDPVTYDNYGDVIPLSKRFDMKNSDIRYCDRDNTPNSFNTEGKTLAEQLNEAYEAVESFDQRYVYVGRFSNAFRELFKGKDVVINDYPIAMNYRDAYLSMHSKETGKYHGNGINYHNLGVGGLESALTSFESPKAIMMSKKQGKIELVLQGVDKKGKTLLSIVAINTKTQNNRKFLDAHIVTSVYGKKSIEKYISNAENEGRLLLTKEEETSQGIPQVQYEGNINEISSDNSIHTSPSKSQEKFSNREAIESERRILELESQIADIEEELSDDIFGDLSSAEVKRLNNQLWGLRNELQKLENSEKKASVKTSLAEIRDNLDKFRYIDLRSLAEGLRWEDYEDLSREQLADAIRHHLDEVEQEWKADGSADFYSVKNGMWVRPINNGAESSDNEGNIIRVRFSDRDPDAITTRGLLADALESTAANDIERKKLADYKKKAKLMTAEEAKLAELRKQIKEASFSKGKRDTEKLKQLKEEATKTANRITTYDRQLLNLESTQALKNVLEREKKKAVEKQKQRDKELLTKKRQKAAEREQAIREEYRESRQKAVEGRHKTEMRNKIKKVVNELNQYLLNGTKEKHVSEGMQTAVAEALSVINMDTVDADARVAEYNARIEKATDPIVIEALTATRDRIQAQGDNLKSKLEALQLGYAKIKQSSDPSLASAYNKGIEDKIASVVDVVGNTPLRNMSMNQLEEVYDLYKLVLTSIRDRNKMFVTAQKETVQELGIEAKTELSEVSKKIEYINSVNKLLRKIGYKDLKPIYFFRMLGSKTMTKLYKAVSNGQGTWYKDMREAKSFRIKAEKEYNYKNWDMKKTYSFTSNSGSSFNLTLQQIMSIYAYYRRDEEKAIRHLVDGGFVFDKSISVIKKRKGVPVKYYVNTAEAFNLSEAIINEIISTLSDEQRAYVEKMQAYLSDTMGAKGNEVSLKLYDVKLFKEKNYFPIKSSSTYMDYNPEESGEVKIKNSGFTKATNQFANNPIVMDDFLNIWTSHVNDMSMYHAFVLPLEDFTRVYNYRNITDRRGAIQATIETNYTEAANSYIKQLFKDINGGSVSGVGTEFVDKMVGLAKKGAVFASASVVVQQPSAIARAMAYVNPKYFANVSSFNFKRHSQLWEECKQYAPIAGIKEMGYFDTSVGRTGIDWLKVDEYDSVREKFFAFFKDKEQRRNIFDDALSFAPAMADELSWVALWEAVKKETRKTTNLEVGSEEFFKHCGERFTEVVDLTQVYDSVFARSELMRSKDRSIKMATSFMAEPTTQANMLFDAALQLKRKGKVSVGAFASVTASVVASMVVNSLLKSAVLAGRDDDEDETYLEKYVASFTGDVLNGMNPLTLVPFVKDVISIIQGYSVDRMDMSVVDALITSVMDFGKDTKTDYDKWTGFIGAVAQLFGIPAKNIIRDINAAVNTFNTFTNGNTTTRTGLTSAIKEGLSGTVTGTIADKLFDKGADTSKGKQYYDAIMSGDTAHANRIVASYDDAKKADQAIVKALKDFEPRITEAAQAHIDGSTTERVRISKEIIADGFAQDYVVKAVNSAINALSKGEDEGYSLKAQSLYSKEDYFDAAYDGNTSEANSYKEELIKFDMDTNDKTREEAESSLNSSFKSAVRKAVIEDGLTMEKATRMLADYGGVTEEKAYELAQGYDFVAQHPDLNYGWEASTVAKYLEKAEPAGISVSVYDDYLVKKSQCKGVDRNKDGKADKGTEKAQIYKMIDSLPITSHQKAVLKLMNK